MLGWYLQLLLVNGYFGINFNFYKLSRTLLKAETLCRLMLKTQCSIPLMMIANLLIPVVRTFLQEKRNRVKLMKKMKLQQTKTEPLSFCIDVLIKGVLIKPVAEQTKGTEIHFALHIATKFDIISKWQRIIAEKRINCIIFEIQTAKI